MTWWFLLSLWLALAGANHDTLPRSSIPRSRRTSRPWNPSAQINEDGFLQGHYSRRRGDWETELPRLHRHAFDKVPVQIRQVPGDGNCLFHSISLCLCFAENGTHWPLDSASDLERLYEHSRHLRQRAVECLRSRRRLFLQGRESLRAEELVAAAAEQYALTKEEYCAAMEQESVWGGGPEIVALSNLLQRPIHVYELACAGGQFTLRRMACFGSPRFDRRPPLHILSADSRFPDIEPGQQLTAGNHFLAVFPLRPKRLRGGEQEYERTSRRQGWKQWWQRLFLLQGDEKEEELDDMD